MERESGRQIFQSYVDRSVVVIWSDGSSQEVTVITVDDEGFVYDLVPKNPNTAFWTAFDEVSDIEALETRD